MTWLRLVLLLCLSSCRGSAQDPADGAARAFAAGEFATALQGFLQAAEQPGSTPGPLLYNAGLCAQRLGQSVKAEWLWRRAALHIPRHVELRARLRESEERLGTTDWTRASTPPGSWLAAFNQRELLALALLLQLAGWTAALLGRRAVRWFGGLLLVCGLAAGVAVAQRSLSSARHAVVQAPELRVLAQPAAEAAAVFSLRAGELVGVAAPGDGEWALVHHPRGSGHVRREALLLVE